MLYVYPLSLSTDHSRLSKTENVAVLLCAQGGARAGRVRARDG